MRTLSGHIKRVNALVLLFWAAIIGIVVGLDQYTKMLAVNLLKPQGTYKLIDGVFQLTYVENTGAAFGMLKDSRWVFMLLSSVAVIAVIAYLIWRGRHIEPLLGVALSMIAGGGIGNMIDRIANGYVVDFFDFTLINFAVFNVADSFVCVGAGLMILFLILTEVKEHKAKSGKAPAKQAEDDNNSADTEMTGESAGHTGGKAR